MDYGDVLVEGEHGEALDRAKLLAAVQRVVDAYPGRDRIRPGLNLIRDPDGWVDVLAWLDPDSEKPTRIGSFPLSDVLA
jgi:hypothetical protein